MRGARRSRGFSLIEAVVIVVVLGVAVPPTLSLMNDAADARADEINATRATMLGTAVLEHILADVHGGSGAPGFNALADTVVYIDTPATGLRDRIAPVTAYYEGMGFSYAVSIGLLANPQGTVTGDTAEDVFRGVTVTVTFPAATGGTRSMPISALLGEVSS